MLFPKTVLAVSAIILALLGVVSLLDPTMTLRLGGFGPTPIEARIEIRAVYGGLHLGIAALMFAAAARERWLRPGLCAQFCVFGGIAAGRLYGMLGADALGGSHARRFVVEVLIAILGAVAFRHAKKIIDNNRYQSEPRD